MNTYDVTADITGAGLVGIDDLVAELGAVFPELPDPVLRRAVMDSANTQMDYLRPQKWIRIPVQAGVADYDLNELVPGGWYVASIVELRHNGCCVPPCHECHECGQCFILDADGVLTLDPPPWSDSLDNWTADVDLLLNSDRCLVPYTLIRKYRRALKHGAYAEIMSMPATAYYDLNRAGVHARTAKGLMVDAVTHRGLRGKSGLHVQRGERIL